MSPLASTAQSSVLDDVAHYGATDLSALWSAPSSAVALIDNDCEVTYGGLREALGKQREQLRLTSTGVRQLVALEMENDVASVVALLAALAEGYPVWLLAPGDLTRHPHLLDTYQAGVIRAAHRQWQPGPGHGTGDTPALHGELALLLSTSGSTGSPKLARLSARNMTSNAAAIALALGLRADDRAITSLPLHYCYGLSILTSHLCVGASVVLSDLSVTERCFWDLAISQQITSLAGVPYTFDLLEALDFSTELSPRLPRLRRITQAGGRLAPERVEEWLACSRQSNWDFVVMYGQTEATARITYLPPHLASDSPGSVGIAVPGVSLRLRTPAGGQKRPAFADPHRSVGELMVSGPGVMLGYAEKSSDLARGRELKELPTGDLAQQGPDGLWHIVGRANRVAKIYGHRLDLERLERLLTPYAQQVYVLGTQHRLHVFAAQDPDTDSASPEGCLATRSAALTGLPMAAITVHQVLALPRSRNGKVEVATLTAQAEAHDQQIAPSTSLSPRAADESADADDVRELFASLLGRPQATLSDSFVSLRGDSLSFVEVSIRLEETLGTLPRGWQHSTCLELAELASRRGSAGLELPTPPHPGHGSRGSAGLRGRLRSGPRWARVDSAIVLRALAVVAILVSHVDLAVVTGGAHVLLVLAGYNLARFVAPAHDSLRLGSRSARLFRTALWIALPASLWLAAMTLVTGAYSWPTVLFANQIVNGSAWDDNWQLWFVEGLVWAVVGLGALTRIRAVERAWMSRPFEVALLVLAATTLLRFLLVGVHAGPLERYSWSASAMFVALGICIGSATTRAAKVCVSALTPLLVFGFFAEPTRELLIIAAVLVVVWITSLPLPRSAVPAISSIAAASLWIYLTQWQVYPPLEAAGHRTVAVVAALIVGVAAHSCWESLLRFTRHLASRGARSTHGLGDFTHAR